MIDKIMNNFDFDAVLNHMKAVNWTWKDNPKPPFREELMETARDILQEALKLKTNISTGGFHAIYHSDKWLELIFEVTSWST